MKKLLCTGVCVVLVAMAGNAGAYMFNDMIDWWNASGTEYGESWSMDTFWDSVRLTENDSLYYMHDISDDVDFANGDLVTSATLELDFTNDFYDGAIYIPTSWLRGYWSDQTEYISYSYSGSGGWEELGEVDNGQYDIGLDVSFINDSNGSLYVLLSVSNYDDGNTDAWLDHSRLYGEAVAAGETAPVPEPATMILFGTGLVGIAGVCMRRKK